MMRPQIVEERIHTDKKVYPAYVDIGKVGSRVHIPFDPTDMPGARELVDHCMAIRDYAIGELIIRELKAAEAKAAKK